MVRPERVMTLLDRFRAQPPQKHIDPVVRLAYVQEIPIDDRGRLAEIARDDVDARVRRATVAKTALREEVALRALGRVGETHALGSIARHAQLELIRLGALSALHDRAEIVSVALNSEFKDTGVAAVE